MHEKILQGVTVGVVAGLFVYWLTSRQRYGFQTTGAQDYSPLTGDVRKVHNVIGTCADCQCCGLPSPDQSSIPLASDFLCDAPQYKAAISEWNLGVSLNLNCGLCGKVYVDKMASAQAHGMRGPATVPAPGTTPMPLTCNPDIPGQVCCTEVV